jgi:hypothetical protein
VISITPPVTCTSTGFASKGPIVMRNHTASALIINVLAVTYGVVKRTLGGFQVSPAAASKRCDSLQQNAIAEWVLRDFFSTVKQINEWKNEADLTFHRCRQDAGATNISS